ncbi:MAG: DUF2339 domain-containing protein, partial [Caulobacteraceae bacterium]|nr:DUF2339 domain-containing protein [Caulobacteraceae bacterium]
MEWLFIVGLGVAFVLQHQRINRLARELDALRPSETTAPRPAPATIAATAAARTAAPSDEERLAAAQAALAAARGRRAPVGPRPLAAPEPAELPPAPVALKAPPPQTTAPPAPAKPAPPPAETARAVSSWLAENGLAWLGGGALALGGLLLVVYAAQRGVFTPPLRVLAALALGAVMVAAGEWIRRQKHAPGGRHMLAAAAAAGAGATTIYGAIWAAHALYDLIPLPLAAALIAFECLLLLAYAFLHGQPLAVLALAGGFLAPAITGPRDWSPPALQTYLGLLIVTGFATAALRGWREAGIVAIAGAFFWALAAWAAVDHVQAILLTLAPALAAGLALEARRRQPAWGDATAAEVLPRIALAVASALALFAWLRVFSESGNVWLPAPALASGLLIATAALLTARRLAPADAFLPPVATAILGVALALYPTFSSIWGPPGETQSDIAAPLALALAAVITACGLAAALLSQDRARTVLAGAGGLGAALLATLAWPAFNALGYAQDAAAPGVLAAAMALGAWALARRSPEPGRDAALGLWIAGAAELLYLCVYGALVPFWAPVGQAAAAVLLALIALRLPWRGLAAAAAAGGLVAFASLLRFDVVELAVSPDTAAWRTALAAGAAAALAFLGGRVLRRSQGRRNEAEALETAALLIALLGGFLLIQRAFLGDQAQTLGPLMAAALRTLLMLAAALLLAWRAREDDGWLARWRLPALLAAGLGYGAVAQGLAFNPWWGGGEAPLGPPLANSLTLAYLAPALMLAAIAWRGIGAGAGWSRVAAAGAFGFGWFWALMAIRDAFHPNGMDSGPTGHAEWAAYALLALAGALALKLAHERGRGGQRLAWLAAAAQPAAWGALAFATLTFWLTANPWWGPDRSSMPLPVAALLLALYAAGAGAMAALAWRARTPESWRPLAQASET